MHIVRLCVGCGSCDSVSSNGNASLVKKVIWKSPSCMAFTENIDMDGIERLCNDMDSSRSDDFDINHIHVIQFYMIRLKSKAML